MANLNFQQPPRSIASQGLNRGGFGSNSLSGHVTPTSGMFPGSGSSFSTPQQLSPNRSIMPNRALFGGQRSFPERRQVLGSVMQDWSSSGMNSVGGGGSSFMSTGAGGSSTGSRTASAYSSASQLTNFHSVFAGGDATTPPLLDPSEFPSLTNRGDSMPQPSASMPGKQPYVFVSAVGMVKQPTAESSEFTMSSEDFPALPGTGGGANSTGEVVSGVSLHGAVGSEKAERVGGGTVSPPTQSLSNPSDGILQASQSLSVQPTSTSLSAPTPTSSIRAPGSEKHSQKRGIQTSPDGKVTNIPNSMVKDQFGMVGLLTFIRAAETDPNLVSLALGQDLTALGLNLNSPDNLYPTFGGPWAEHPCRAQDIDYHVPPEYIINHSIKDKLAQVKLTRYKDDLLFFMFYTSVGDMLQLAAANELYLREWRYHMEEKVWLTQAPGCGVIEKTSTYERGTYYFFDAQNWRKVAKEFHLDYSKLENQPSIPGTALSPFHAT